MFSGTTFAETIRAYNAGIINVTLKNTFTQNGNLTREQLCVMIENALEKAGIE